MHRYLKTIQGVGGLVFGNNEDNAQEDDGGVERLLERIKTGVLAEDRHQALQELQDVVAESRSAQLAFGATGLPIVLKVLRDDRSDLDLVRAALETLVNALRSEGPFHGNDDQVQPGVLNCELLSREEGSVSLLLSLLNEEDFYVRYHTLGLLTMLSRNSSVRLQEAVLATPQGITRLMDMMQDREVIRNEALLLLTFLTRSAEEIQKLVVFEGVFEKLFNIIMEEGGSDGGIVVQDCLDLLNNILRGSPANQSFLRETIGLQPIITLLKLRSIKNSNLSQQKTVNLLFILETINILLSRDPAKASSKDANVMTNQTLLIQNNALDHLFYLAIEGRLTAADVRCAALKCIGNLVRGHTRNLEMLSKKMIGEELDREVSLNAVLHVLLNTTDLSEWMAADHVIKCFCEGNPEGQVVLASTLSPAEESQTNGNKPHKNNKHLPFGRILLHALDINKEQKDIVASCRAARVLTYVLQGNQVCKEKVLEIISEVTSSPLSNPEYMLSACVKYISSAASLQARREERDHTGRLCFVALMLRLLVTWFAECPKVVASFLETGGHLLCVVELLVNKEFSTSHHVSSLAAVVLGECIVYNPCADGPQCASMVVDTISQRIGLSSYFEMWEKLQKDAYFLSAAVKAGLLNISADASMDGEQSSPVVAAHNNEEHFEADIQSMIKATYDKEFVTEVQKLQPIVKEKTLLLFSHPKSEVIIPSLVNRNEGEGDDSYIERLQTLLQKQAQEMQEIMVKNVALAEELVNRSGDKDLQGERSGIVGESQGFAASRIEIEATKQRIQAYQQRIEKMEQQQHEKEQEALYYKQLSEKHEADLKALSAAYNSLEQANFRLEDEVQNLKKGAHGTAVSAGLSISDLDAAREEGRQEGAKASEAELNDLLVCLGQEESKVERLRARLEELGEDVEALLQDIDEEQEREHDVSE